VKRQRIINEKRKQVPPYRDIKQIILKKSRYLLSECDATTRARMQPVCRQSQLMTSTSESTPQIGSDSIDLVVTSPPFLDIVQYAADNWLRCWFLGINA